MKIISKFMSAVVSVVVMMTCVSVLFSYADLTASADAFSGTCGDGVEWSFDSSTGDLNITGTGKMRSYALYSMEKELPWYNFRGEIEGVIVHEGVTRVGDYAFYNCPNVTYIELPMGLESIGTSAFENCKRLCFMVFPCTLTEIGGNVLKGTQLLEGLQNSYTLVTMDHVLIDAQAYMEEATVPETVTCIASEAFSKNDDVKKIYIPDTVTDIGIQAFGYCENLEEVRLPEGLTKLSTNTFINCKSLKSIDIPDSVSVVGDKAFYGSGVKDMTLSRNVKTVGSMAFGQCPDLDSITFYNKDCVIYDSKYTVSNSSGFTGIIYGYKNSTAEAYADKYGYKFVPLGEDTPQVTEPAVTTVNTTTKTTTVPTAVSLTTSKAETSASRTSNAVTTMKTTVSTTSSVVTTTVSSAVTVKTTPMGDANGDGKVDVRDAAFIARSLAAKRGGGFPHSADFNGDGKVNVRDAAAIAAYLAGNANPNKFYPYMLLDMTGSQITGKYGPSDIIEYPAEGGNLWCVHPSKQKDCYAVLKQVTNNPYAEDYSPSVRMGEKPFFIAVSNGYANDLLHVNMTLSELINIIGDQPMWFSMINDEYFMNYSDGGYKYEIHFAFPKGKQFIYPDETENVSNLSKNFKKSLINSGMYIDSICIFKQ